MNNQLTEQGMMDKINKRERGVLSLSWICHQKIHFEGNGNAYWEGDHLAPFRALATLDSLVKKGLMDRYMDGKFGGFARATKDAGKYRCKALLCQNGSVYENDGCYDIEIGKCPTCEGTGMVLFHKELKP